MKVIIDNKNPRHLVVNDIVPQIMAKYPYNYAKNDRDTIVVSENSYNKIIEEIKEIYNGHN